MSYHLLLGIDDPDLTTETRALLEESGDFETVEATGSAHELIAAMSRHDDIDVVLIHEDLGPLPVLHLVRDLGIRYPHIAIVLMVREGTADILTSAMEAGVRAIVTMPLSFEDLHTRLGVAAQWSRTIRARLTGAITDLSPGLGGLMIAVAGAKGGTGVTTIAVHLALTAAARRDRRVCLVDFDLQTGDIPHYLDLTHRRSVLDLADVADDLTGRSFEDALYSHPSGLRILLAPHDGERGEDVSARAARQILGGIKSRFDIVIVDCAAVVSEAASVAVEMADEALIVATPDVVSLRAAKRLVKLWGRLQIRKEDDVKVVINRGSRGSEVQPELARRVVGAPMTRTVLPAAFRSLEAAINAGTPERLEESPLRRALLALGAELGITGSGTRGPARAGASSSARGGRRRAERGESGQVAVEMLGITFVALVVLVAIWELTWGLFGFVLASNAANAGARVLATDPASGSNLQADVSRAVMDRLPGVYHTDANAYIDLKGYQPAVEVTLNIPLVPGVIRSPFQVSARAGTHREVPPP